MTLGQEIPAIPRQAAAQKGAVRCAIGQNGAAMAVSAQKDEVDEHQIVVVVGFDGLDAAILALQNPAEALGRDPFQGRQHSSLVAQARRRRELAAGASAAGTV